MIFVQIQVIPEIRVGDRVTYRDWDFKDKTSKEQWTVLTRFDSDCVEIQSDPNRGKNGATIRMLVNYNKLDPVVVSSGF